MKLQEVTINQKFTVTEGTTSMTVRQQRRMTNKIHFSDTDRCLNSTNSYNVNNEKKHMSKKFKVSLIPRYEGKRRIQYETIRSTIRKTIHKTRLYKFIRVFYSQPQTKTDIKMYFCACYIILRRIIRGSEPVLRRFFFMASPQPWC